MTTKRYLTQWLFLFICLVFFVNLKSQAKTFYIADGDVYGSKGLVAAMKEAISNQDKENIIYLAPNGKYEITRLYRLVIDGSVTFGPVGLPDIPNVKSPGKK
ncbi:MAG: hypothetical protein HC880_05995 [Bacteroidia bacterium]|nr:hypothetical protein [Bacteroidia bacterium]